MVPPVPLAPSRDKTLAPHQRARVFFYCLAHGGKFARMSQFELGAFNLLSRQVGG